MKIRFLLLAVFFMEISLCHAEEVRPVILVIGTRPEAIKMAPIYQALKNENIPTCLCSTGQHAELLTDSLASFDLKPDFELSIMKPDQDLFYLTEEVLKQTRELFQRLNPKLVVVQGDTTTSMASALAAFYLKIPIAHIEAGLRSFNKQRPYPEEFNRRMISLIATHHFAPTKQAKRHLMQEGVPEESIYCVGNTVVDALQQIRNKIRTKAIIPSSFLINEIKKVQPNEKSILLTMHRREAITDGMDTIFRTIAMYSKEHPDTHFFFPMHPNPHVKKIAAQAKLSQVSNIHILPPLSYHDLVYLLDHVDGVATDSGGIQEEATSLQKPTLILRTETGRPEAIEAGVALLVGMDQQKIHSGMLWMDRFIQSKSSFQSPYGDGHSGVRIAKIIRKLCEEK